MAGKAITRSWATMAPWPVLTQEVKATHSQKLAVAFEFVGGSAKIASKCPEGRS